MSLFQPVHVTAFYGAVLAGVFVALSARTLLLRRRPGIAIGDSGDERMLRAMRVHANFAEYVPLTLLMLLLLRHSNLHHNNREHQRIRQ